VRWFSIVWLFCVVTKGSRLERNMHYCKGCARLRWRQRDADVVITPGVRGESVRSRFVVSHERRGLVFVRHVAGLKTVFSGTSVINP
jgi:hypothetical protein